ncbi:head GIN domain-containing protein [Lutibacter sp. B1]|uniref:head GIN domain-containing protein n=1 Tax=Lutibacter sp. B1 TaxID=2725996 RepID=UPI0014571753|nr:head GIN domain-containing protein [Lutibacter sp. B1]NLP56616.1 DUF2807 domain-containing protein [Lutibacter sp. B1]
MKKLISLIVLLTITVTINAQFFNKKINGNGNITTETRKISNFDKISVGGSFHVELFKSNENTITIKGDENVLEFIVTEVENNKLKIYFEKGYNINTRKAVQITVPFKNLEEVALAGSGDIISNDVIEADTLETSIAGSGDIELKVSTNKLSSNVAGSGNTNFTGNTNDFNCSIAGSGDIMAYDLTSKIATIKIAGSGDVKVNVTDEIHTSNVGSGDVYYKGNPSVIKAKSVGSGDIIDKN